MSCRLASRLIFLVAELVSAYPTAGGMYFVTKNVVPQEHAALWSWVMGWCNLLGQTAGVASLAYSNAQQMFAAASMNSTFDGTHYSFSPYVCPSFTLIHLSNSLLEHLSRSSSSQSPFSFAGALYAP